MKKIILMSILLALIVIVAGQSHLSCNDEGMINKDLRTVQMQIGKRTFTLEVAETDRTREIGLMNRKSMPEDHGMIFVYSRDQEMGFWMKNTLIPLDIIFIDGKGKMVSIHQMAALDEKHTTYSKGPARYAIELNKGMAEEAGVKEGDVLKLPESVK